MTIVAWVFIIMGLFLVFRAVKGSKTETKKNIAMLSVIGIAFLIVGISIKPSHDTKDNNETKTVSHKSNSSQLSVPKTDKDVLNAFKSNLTSGDTNTFINKYIELKQKEQSAYYQKFRALSPVVITGQAFQTNNSGTRLYIYVNTKDPSNVYLNREQSYEGLEDSGQLHNVFIAKGQPHTFNGVQLMSTVKVQGTLGATNLYEKGKTDMPFDLNDATITQ